MRRRPSPWPWLGAAALFFFASGAALAATRRSSSGGPSAAFPLATLTKTSQPYPNVPDAAQIAALNRLAANVLEPLQRAVGRPIVVNSAFRSYEVNRAVGGVSSSQHLTGEAADIKIIGMTNIELATAIYRLRLPVDQLIIEGPPSGWVHVSHRAYGNRGQYLISPDTKSTSPWAPS